MLERWANIVCENATVGKNGLRTVSYIYIPKTVEQIPGIRADPDWKNNSDQMYSCPRDWRLSAAKLRTPVETPHTIVLGGFEGGPLAGP